MKYFATEEMTPNITRSYLVLAVFSQEPVVGCGSHGEQVGWQGAEDSPLVPGHRVQAVDVEHAVGVHRHKDAPCNGRSLKIIAKGT